MQNDNEKSHERTCFMQFIFQIDHVLKTNSLAPFFISLNEILSDSNELIKHTYLILSRNFLRIFDKIEGNDN